MVWSVIRLVPYCNPSSIEQWNDLNKAIRTRETQETTYHQRLYWSTLYTTTGVSLRALLLKRIEDTFSLIMARCQRSGHVTLSYILRNLSMINTFDPQCCALDKVYQSEITDHLQRLVKDSRHRCNTKWQLTIPKMVLMSMLIMTYVLESLSCT